MRSSRYRKRYNHQTTSRCMVTGKGNTMEIRIAIQCRDRRTNQVGTFGYRKERVRYSSTPVFPGMLELIEYCREHEIDFDYTPEE